MPVLKRLLRPLRYRGRGVECPCCGGRFRRFVVLPEYVETERACYRCDSYARHRLVWLYLIRETDLLSAPRRLLHVAPSEPMYGDRLRALPNLDYVSADLEAPEAMEHWDITAIPHPAGSFDAILCSHVLEHVCDDRRAIAELHRVLRHGGWALIQSPVDPTREITYEEPVEDPLAVFGQADHVRFYGRDYPDRLREAGFDVAVEHYVERFSAAERERYGLDPVEPIYLCTKP
ncbi:MAG: methyltransferase domain-containing protein [Actinomycetota bacterium]|nr:methyltransferase domain-containing protein [Actinomycetota bacterium]